MDSVLLIVLVILLKLVGSLGSISLKVDFKDAKGLKNGKRPYHGRRPK